MRRLVGAPDGGPRRPSRRARGGSVQDAVQVGARAEVERGAVEGAPQVERCREGLAPEPQRPELRRSGISPPTGIAITNSGGSPTPTMSSVTCCPRIVASRTAAGGQVVGLGEPVAHHGLGRSARLGEPPGQERERVEAARALVGDGDDNRREGLAEARHLDARPARDAGLDGRHARDRAERLGVPFGRARERHEGVGEAGLAVEPGLRLLERDERRRRQHVRRHAARQHERDGRGRSPVSPHVAEKLLVDRSHGATTRGRGGRPGSRPPRRTRSGRRSSARRGRPSGR